MLTTSEHVLEALRARQAEIGLSNAIAEEISGLTVGAWDKALGPSRTRTPTLPTLMAIAGALGLGVELVPDPDSKIARRYQRRKDNYVHSNGRIGQGLLKRARPIILSEVARKAARALWAGKTPEQRTAHIAMMNIRRAARRLARKRKAA